MTRWNQQVPIRPITLQDGQPLQYRTRINKPDTNYRVLKAENMVCQLKLYNWCLSLDYVNMVPIADLHAFLFYRYPDITKRMMGSTMVQTVPYKFRILKGVCSDNDHATMCYAFKHREELQYGLEWMLSMWVWGIENSWDSMPRDPEERQEMVKKILAEIGSCSEQELDNLFCDFVLDGELAEQEKFREEPMWFTLWAKNDWGVEDLKPAPTERPKLRGL